jgi:hypothetical protein
MAAALLSYSSADSTVMEVWETETTTQPITEAQASAFSFPLGQFLLVGIIGPGWQILQPLLITLEQDEDGSYLASEDLFGVYGEGSTPSEAVEDYLVSLIDYYQLIGTRVDDTSFARTMFARLQRYVSRIPQ